MNPPLASAHLWAAAVRLVDALPPARARDLSAPLCRPLAARTEGALTLPQGQGAGVHCQQSPLAPLSRRSDVVPVGVAHRHGHADRDGRIVATDPAAEQALHPKLVRVQGFMPPGAGRAATPFPAGLGAANLLVVHAWRVLGHDRNLHARAHQRSPWHSAGAVLVQGLL